MNKDIKYIVEDLLGDFYNDSDDQDIFQGLTDVALQETVKLIKEILKYDNNSFFYYKLQIDTIKYELTDNVLSYYYINTDGKKEELSVLRYSKAMGSLNIFQKLFDLLSQCNDINYIKLTIIINMVDSYYQRSKYDDIKNYVLDFYNLNFERLNLTGVNAKNIIIDESYKNKEYISNYPQDFNQCILNNIEIKDVYNLNLSYVYDITDYSFIKNIRKRLSIDISPTSMPQSNSLKGLPNGNYEIIMDYNNRYYAGISEIIPENTMFSLEGVPTTLESLLVRTNKQMLPYFSFKGITESMIKNSRFTFVARDFGGKYNPYIIQMGPYKIEFGGKNWKPTKPQLLGIIKANDWFLDCYRKDRQPNKEYIPSSEADQVQLEKIQQKEKQKQDNKEQKKLDDIEDTQLKIDRIKKVIQVGDIFNRKEQGYYTYEILEMGEKNIKFKQFYKTVRTYNKVQTYKQFLEYFVEPYSNTYTNQKGEFLYDLIIKPVEKRRARIVKKRKEELKAAKKLEKEQVKQQLKNNFNNQEQEVEVQQQTPKLNIEIVEYSEKALALFGDTYQIKDKLKELGAHYNARLKYKSGIKPGWVISKKKKEQVEQIINGNN